MPPSRWIKRAIAVLCACSFATVSATTITLTFDHLGEIGPYPDSYTESGFIITSLSDGGHLHADTGALWLHSRDGSSPYRIERVDGGTFDFLGFDYSGGDSVFVSSTGASFTILGDQPLATFTMPSTFGSASYIAWYMNNPGDLSTPDPQWGRIANIVLNVPAVPEPTSPAMLGLGLAGIVLVRTRTPMLRKG